jgi:hypothetical protein
MEASFSANKIFRKLFKFNELSRHYFLRRLFVFNELQQVDSSENPLESMNHSALGKKFMENSVAPVNQQTRHKVAPPD